MIVVAILAMMANSARALIPPALFWSASTSVDGLNLRIAVSAFRLVPAGEGGRCGQLKGFRYVDAQLPVKNAVLAAVITTLSALVLCYLSTRRRRGNP
jgi:hypothetical protein